jgi:25S rRNA (adenine2142-N1)-methyltransferase
MGRTKGKTKLKTGRPPAIQKKSLALPSTATRTIIRSHHRLQKDYAQAQKHGDKAKMESIASAIEGNGGLPAYQLASIKGQSKDRGGDSSKMLMTWLRDMDALPKSPEKYRMLEVGALSTENACSRSSAFNVTRIDLNSQDPKIERQDFMERPLPSDDAEKFDTISMSLVLNFVPTPEGRGEMLKRTRSFLRTPAAEHGQNIADAKNVWPSLFLVLPKACISNSRYLTEDRLNDIMASIGYRRVERKNTAKLTYSLWIYRPETQSVVTNSTFGKKKVNDGRDRNNFAIVLR